MLAGQCEELTNSSFLCHCPHGWQGDRCQLQVDHCANVTCENRGVCRSSSNAYACECLGDSYSGRHCEIKSSRTATRQVVSRSVAYVAILAMTSAALFVVTMDVLRYGFGIGPPEVKKKKTTTTRKARTYLRLLYVHAPVAPSPHMRSSVLETTII